MNRTGKKGKEWLKDRTGLIKEAVANGRISLVEGKVKGKCTDCSKYTELDPDHKKKRSQGGDNSSENIDWVCRSCHDKRDNQPGSIKQSGKKAEWQKKHECKHCKLWTSFLLCDNCGYYSV